VALLYSDSSGHKGMETQRKDVKNLLYSRRLLDDDDDDDDDDD